MKAPSNFKDITGQIFSRLTVIHRHGTNKEGKATWLCRCDCGAEKIICGKSLRAGHSQSCGCLNSDATAKRNLKHGMASRGNKHPLYSNWCRIKQRCHNPDCEDYYLYGGRGVKVCERWRNSFEAFLEDVGSSKPAGTSIDRYPNREGNYEPGNTRWGTDEMQANNKRNNVILSLNGEEMTIAQWARKLNCDSRPIHARIERGWSHEDALTTPIRKMIVHPPRLTKERIQTILESPHVSGAEFARKYGVTRTAICHVRKGRIKPNA